MQVLSNAIFLLTTIAMYGHLQSPRILLQVQSPAHLVEVKFTVWLIIGSHKEHESSDRANVSTKSRAYIGGK